MVWQQAMAARRAFRAFISPMLPLIGTYARPCAHLQVDLTNCGLSSFPPHIAFRAAKVTQLKLAHNKLVSLPPMLSTFTSLNTVVLDNNELVNLPETLLRLPKLSILMASSNRIGGLPHNLGDYTQLQALVLQVRG